MEKLIYNAKIVPAIAANDGTVGSMTAIEVDGRGFDRAQFVFDMGVATTGGKFNAKVQSSDASGGTFADVTDAALAEVTKAAGDNKVELIDMPIDGAKPFMQLVAATSAAAFPNSCIVILYRGSGIRPVTQVAGQSVIL